MRGRLLAGGVAVLVLAGCARTPFSRTDSCGCVLVRHLSAGEEEQLLARDGDRVGFAFDHASLDGRAWITLAAQVKTLTDADLESLPPVPGLQFLIAGNADERGTEAYNLALGQRRADAARNALVAMGIPSARIRTVSYGKDCPVAPGHDEEAWRQNRVAIISVVGFNPQDCR